MVSCPDPNAIVEAIHDQQQWEPNLTPAFFNQYNLKAFLAFHTRSMATFLTGKQPSCLVVRSFIFLSTCSMASSTVMGLSLQGTSPSPPGGMRVENMHFNLALFGIYKTNSMKSKTLWTKIDCGDLPPLPLFKVMSTKPMCLVWHTKGQCNTNCPSITNHIAYSPNEYAPLVTLCRDHGYHGE